MALNNHVEKFTLDMAPGGIAPVLNVSQGDIGRKFTADIFWGGSSYDVSGLTAKVRGRKRDNTVFEYVASLSGTTATFETKKQMTIIPGNVDCEIVFFDSSSHEVGTANFTMIVEEAPYDPDAPSQSVISGIEDLIEQTIGGDVSDEVDAWLDAHPEATTTVQDGAITKAKINTAFLSEIENAYVTPEMFGAVGDGTTDDTAAINAAIYAASTTNKKAVVFSKSYAVSVSASYADAITLKSGIDYIFLGNAKVKLLANSYDGYQIIGAQNITDFKLINCKIEGDVATHSGTTGQWGHGLSILGCSNFYIDKIEVSDTCGDGVYINNGQSITKNGYIGTVFVDNAGRSGVTFESGESIVIDTIYCKNISRHNPKCCLDMEMDIADLTWNNVVINNIYSFDCVGGVRVVPYHATDSTIAHDVQLKIGTVTISHENTDNIDTSAPGFLFESTFNEYYTGTIDVQKIICKNMSKHRPVLFKTSARSDVFFSVENVTLENIGHLSNSQGGDYSVFIATVTGYPGGNFFFGGLEEINSLPIYTLFVSAQTAYGFVNASISINSEKPIYTNTNAATPAGAEPIDWLDSEIIVKTSMFPTYQEHSTNRFTSNFIATKYIIDDDLNGLLFPTIFPIRNHDITIIKTSVYTSTYNFGNGDWTVYPRSTNKLGDFKPSETGAFRVLQFTSSDLCILKSETNA